MKKNFFQNYFVMLMFPALLMAILVSCEYETIEVDAVGSVTFSQDVLPIFTKCTGCHSGGLAPNLTPANAFSAIVPAFVSLSNPAQSAIYTIPAPSGNHPVKYTPGEAAIILAWIEQGTQNN